jgi:hypothetical protein
MITVFTCGSHRARCTAPGCGQPTTLECEFALGGRRTGETCGLAICEHHSAELSGRRVCRPHQVLIERRAPR